MKQCIWQVSCPCWAIVCVSVLLLVQPKSSMLLGSQRELYAFCELSSPGLNNKPGYCGVDQYARSLLSSVYVHTRGQDLSALMGQVCLVQELVIRVDCCAVH